MINLDSIEKYPSAFPVFKSHNLINDSLYQDLKATWPDFTKFRTTGFSPSAAGGGAERPEILKSGRNIEYVVENNQWMYQVWYGQKPMVLLNVFCYAELMLIFFYNFS